MDQRIEDEGRVLTVFRSRLREDNRAEFEEAAARMDELAQSMPGFVEYKTFTADDGERVSIIVFDSEEHQRGWRQHAEHVAAQKRGRDEFYASYDLSVCKVVRRSRFP
jgi:heme-degrading monooxygenase HmoA